MGFDPPEVRINWLNVAQIESENAIGDIVNLELALEFSNILIYIVSFKVHLIFAFLTLMALIIKYFNLFLHAEKIY